MAVERVTDSSLWAQIDSTTYLPTHAFEVPDFQPITPHSYNGRRPDLSPKETFPLEVSLKV